MARPWQARLYIFDGVFDKPQVIGIATRLGVSRFEVVGRIMKVWFAFQVKADTNGIVAGRTGEWVDLLAELPGFAQAMSVVGWLSMQGDRLVVPGFDDFISKKAIKRIENAMRMAGRREAEGAGPDDHIEHIPPHTATYGHKVPVAPVQPDLPGMKSKPPKKPRAVKIEDPNFWRFWRSYPWQANQPDAAAAWKELSPDAGLVEIILAAVETQKKSPQWSKDNGQFIPLPGNYIRDRRWQDRLEPAAAGGGIPQSGRVRSGTYGRKPKFGEPAAGAVPPAAQPGLFDAQAEEPGPGA